MMASLGPDLAASVGHRSRDEGRMTRRRDDVASPRVRWRHRFSE